MPEVPAFLADFLEPRFGKPVDVLAIEELALNLRRVRFGGDSLRGASFRPGQEVEFRVGERAFRHYSPASFDAEGSFEIVFFLHGSGPGASWAWQLRVGQRVNVLGPGGGFTLRDDARAHVLLGDETTLGVFSAFTGTGRRCVGAVEVASPAPCHSKLLGHGIDVVARRAVRGDALLEWVRSCRFAPADGTCFYLAGHAASVAALRRSLLTNGWPRRCVRTKAYWAEGKRGL